MRSRAVRCLSDAAEGRRAAHRRFERAGSSPECRPKAHSRGMKSPSGSQRGGGATSGSRCWPNRGSSARTACARSLRSPIRSGNSRNSKSYWRKSLRRQVSPHPVALGRANYVAGRSIVLADFEPRKHAGIRLRSLLDSSRADVSICVILSGVKLTVPRR